MSDRDEIEFLPLPERGKRRPNLRADKRSKATAVWEARVAGATWDQAAQIAGYANGSNAQKAVVDIYGTTPRVDREHLRNLWRDRLEVTWKQALRDMIDQKPGAITAAVRVATAAAVLDGLNAPTQVNLAVSQTFETLLTEIEANVYA